MFVRFFYFTYFNRWVVVSHCGFNFNFSKANVVKHLFITFSIICTFFCVPTHWSLLSVLKIGLFYCVMSLLYIIDIFIMYVFCKYFLLVYGLFFTFLTIFEEPRFLTLNYCFIVHLCISCIKIFVCVSFSSFKSLSFMFMHIYHFELIFVRYGSFLPSFLSPPLLSLPSFFLKFVYGCKQLLCTTW